MVKIIDQQLIRHLNVFWKVCNVKAKDCFIYNNKIIFAVPRHELSRTIGEGGKNIKKLNRILPKRSRIVPLAKDLSESGDFISDIIYPSKYKGFEILGEEILINTSGVKNKAELMGRNKTRMKELQNIVKQYFNKNLKII